MVNAYIIDCYDDINNDKGLMMKFSLSLTHDCNLNCHYCYAGEKTRKNMSLETAEKAIDFAFQMAPINNKIDFSFFGGEPLLRFDLMQSIVSNIQRKALFSPAEINYSVTTNGTIYKKKIIDFINKNNIYLCISIDGPQHVHDRNRVNKQGKGSFATVFENLKKLTKEVNYFQINAVYGPDTVNELSESVKFFTSHGFNKIHLNPDITNRWEESTYDEVFKSHEKIAEHYISCYQNGQEISVNTIDSKVILFLKNGYEPSDKCGMGETEWGIAPSGNVYPCERLIGNDDEGELCMGNVHTCVIPAKRCEIGKKRGNSNESCVTCPVQKYCMNWCGCTNYNMTGRTDKAGPMLCLTERASITAAKHVFMKLKDNEIFINHFLNYAVMHNHSHVVKGGELWQAKKRA